MEASLQRYKFYYNSTFMKNIYIFHGSGLFIGRFQIGYAEMAEKFLRIFEHFSPKIRKFV